MSDIAIRCEGLSKRYRIGEQQRYKALRDVLTDAAAVPFRRWRASLDRKPKIVPSASENSHRSSVPGPSYQPLPSGVRRPPRNDFIWALDDVSFGVKRGEVVGVIGRNGAGKSTLLKILSRITKPTKGHAKIHGRVGSLLEVGTGFHPELTGRENIYLNGAILGMRKGEIEHKFDEIIAFAEVERFVDTPVKRYSSGMYVRLAFAVAAHLETEVLLVDEVLAVGDAQFQKKCLGKIGDVSRAGRTILFVSHNMAAVSNLCSSVVLLVGGQMISYGSTLSVIDGYLGSGFPQREEGKAIQFFRPSWASSWITCARVSDTDGNEKNNFPMGANVGIEIGFEGPESSTLRSPVMGVVINHTTMGVVGGVNTRMTGFESADGPYHSGSFKCLLNELPFLQGTYTVDVWLGDGPRDLDCLQGYLRFTIEESDIYGTGNTPVSKMGVAFLNPEWELLPQENTRISQ